MTSPKPAWPRLNLPAANLSELRLLAKVPIDDKTAELVKPLLEGSDGISVTSYRRSSTVHIVVATIEFDRDDPTTLQVRLRYNASDWARERKSVPQVLKREAEFARLLDTVSSTVGVGFAADFEFPSVGEEDVWFPLPLIFPDDNDEDSHFEVRGVSGVHKTLDADPSEWDYHFELDRFPNQLVLLTLRWQDELQLTRSTIEGAFTHSTEIVQQLVVRKDN